MTTVRAREAQGPSSRRSATVSTPSPAPRAELLHVLTLPDYDRAGHIGELYGHPATRALGELLIDAEEDRHLRAVLVGLLRERAG